MVKFVFFCLSIFYLSADGLAQTDTSITTHDTIFDRGTTLKDDTLAKVTNSSLLFTPSELERDKKRIYKLKPAIDVPLTAISSAWTLYALAKYMTEILPQLKRSRV